VLPKGEVSLGRRKIVLFYREDPKKESEKLMQNVEKKILEHVREGNMERGRVYGGKKKRA
jgi:hypothetical protein